MSKKNKKNCDTKEFTAVKKSDCQSSGKDCKKQPEQMRMTDRDPKPSFEV